MTTKLTVKTLNNELLRAACRELNDKIFADFPPDIIVGIRSGGYVVGEIMTNESAHRPKLVAISRKRASTQTKSRIKGLKQLLGLLPYAITDRLRIIEHKKLTAAPASAREFTPDSDELSALRTALQKGDVQKILIVDDAVDSGATMKEVYNLLKKEAPSSCTIKTAALTVTAPSPLINPDYLLYKNVLIRFPWSFDFKG